MADGNSSPASNTNGADNGNNNTPPPTNAMPAAMPDAMPPSPPPVEQQQIEINFNGSTGESVTFKLKNTTKLRKAMDAYSARVQRPVDQLRFLFDGARLGNEDTPAAHDMVDGDIVEVHMEQLGGGSEGEKLEDWVEVKDSDDDLLQKTIEEKARLRATTDRLKKELSALKANNRALAKENNDLKVDKKDLKAEYQELFVEFRDLMAEHEMLHKLIHSLKTWITQLDKEKRDLNNSLYKKDGVIDSVLKDLDVFKFS